MDSGRLQAHQAFQDLEIAFEDYRRLHERWFRGEPTLPVDIDFAAQRLNRAHNAYRRWVLDADGGARRVRPRGHVEPAG
jgi:hypothetical protein